VRWVRQPEGAGVPNVPAAASPPRAGGSAPR
jgi:hypothetical protein